MEILTPDADVVPNQESLTSQRPKSFFLFFIVGIVFVLLSGIAVWYFSHRTSSIAKIEGWVFVDSNKNEKMDEGEQGLSGFQVTLSLFETVNEISVPAGFHQATTDEKGHYTIMDIPTKRNNSYLMGLNLDNTHEFTNKNMSFNVKIPPDATFNFPLTVRADIQTVRGSVFEDTNKNGVKDEGETGLVNVIVGLYKNGGGVTQKTLGDGLFAFPNEYSGYYTLTIKIPDGYSTTESKDGVFLNRLIHVEKDMKTVDVGIIKSSKKVTSPTSNKAYTISGNVFEDANGNGKEDLDENPVSGSTLVIQQLESNQLVPTNISTFMDTDINGYFSSDHPQPQLPKQNLIGGYYKVGWTDNSRVWVPTTLNNILLVLNYDKKINFGIKRADGSSKANTVSVTHKPAAEPIEGVFNFSLENTEVAAKRNELIQFKGIMSNNTDKDIYLNGIGFQTSSSELVADGAGFSTFPTKLKPGESYKGILFTVYVSQVAQSGEYSGGVSLQGGKDSNTYDNLGSPNFLINIVEN